MFWTIFWEWAEFAVRWLHLVTAIAWIGSSLSQRSRSSATSAAVW